MRTEELEYLPEGLLEEEGGTVVPYSLALHGNVKISKNFHVNEFSCHDGTDTVLVDKKLLPVLEGIRAHFGAPVIVLSGYRTPGYNAKVGGREHSQHQLGRAADIRIPGVKPSDIYAFLDAHHEGGLGSYGSFTHVDTRGHRSRWAG